MEVLKSIENFFNRFPEANELGDRIALDELERLPDVVKRNIPEFWKTALMRYTLSNLEIGVPNDFGQPELKSLKREELPLMSIQFLSPSEIYENMTETFTGLVLVQKSILSRKAFVCIATDVESTLEGIYISTNKDDSQPLLIFHDYGITKKELIRHSLPISSGLAMLFKEAHIKNRNRIISGDQAIAAKELINVLIEELKKSVLSTPERIPESNSISEQDILNRIIESAMNEITNEKIGCFIEKLSEIAELSISNKKELWNKIHEIYDKCGLHKGDLYFNEAHAMI